MTDLTEWQAAQAPPGTPAGTREARSAARRTAPRLRGRAREPGQEQEQARERAQALGRRRLPGMRTSSIACSSRARGRPPHHRLRQSRMAW